MKKINIILSFIFIALVVGFVLFIKWAIPIMGTQTDLDNVKKESQTIVESGIDKPQSELKIAEFLENPINLQEFKRKKGKEFTTSVTSGTEYYYQPKIKDSIFYIYYYPDFKKESIKIDQFVVFKHGKNKHIYEDQTETLIEFRIFNPDSDLGKANLFGLTKSELESEFGSDYLTFDNGIAYSSKNKVLILELKNSKVKSFNYIKLNTEKIDGDLIRQIME